MEPIDLNPSGQAELYERSVRRMAELLPGWSDAIPSDPAVTVLELLTGLSDVQNERIDEVWQEHYLAYLKLLGERPRALSPARLRALPETRAGLFPHMRFQIDGMTFEVEDGWQYGDARVREAALERDGKQRRLSPRSPLRLAQEDWGRLVISFTGPLPAGSPVHLWCEIAPEPGRVPPDGETPAPFRLQGSVWASEAEAWEEVRIQDGTCGFLRSGWLEWTPPAASDRLCLTADGQVEGAPLLTALALEPVALVQRRSRSITMDLQPPFYLPYDGGKDYALRFFLPTGDGAWREEPALFARDGRVRSPDGAEYEAIRVVAVESGFSAQHTLRPLPMEWVALEEDGILPESLRVMMEEDGAWYDCPVCVPKPDRTLERGCRWDAKTGRLCFGDGRDFHVPKGGKVLIAGCACTMGAAGNGAGGELRSGGVRLFALGTARGGQDSEAPKDGYVRVAEEQSEPLRAVTCDDHAELARRTPGLALEQVTALPGPLKTAGNGIRLFVLPRSSQPLPELTAWQKARLVEWMERFRLIGVPVMVQGPRYLPVQVSVTLRTAGRVSEAELRAVALKLVDGVRGGAAFGAKLSHPALYSALNAADGVLNILALELRPMGRGAKRTQDGSWTLEKDVLPYLEAFEIKQA